MTVGVRLQKTDNVQYFGGTSLSSILFYMYLLYYGTDRQQVRDAATQYIEKNLPPDATLTTLDAQSYQSGQIADALGASSLFGGEEWFVVDTPSAVSEFDEEVKNALKELSESGNTFILLESALLAPAKKAYSKYAKNVEEFTAQKNAALNPFALADAIAQKDRKRLWVLLQEMRTAGLPTEELIGILWWQLKSLRLAAVTQSAAEAGMKDFPYNKAKRALGAFTPGELEQLSQSLLAVYHDGHAGLRDIDLALEQWVLAGK